MENDSMKPPICLFCGKEMTKLRELKTVIMFECKDCDIGESRLKKQNEG